MMLRKFAALLKRASAAAGLVSLVALSGQAGAVVYVGSYDPPLPAPFSGYKWAGTVTFNLPCLSLGNTYSGVVGVIGAVNPVTLDCPGMSLVGGTVQFYDADGEYGSPLIFGSSTIFTEVDLANGVPQGIWGDFANPQLFTLGGKQARFNLSFGGPNGIPVLSWTCKSSSSSSRLSSLTSRSKDKDKDDDDDDDDDCKPGSSGLSGDTAAAFKTDEWRQVPEPGSLALIGSALGALALIRPRRRKAAQESIA